MAETNSAFCLCIKRTQTSTVTCKKSYPRFKTSCVFVFAAHENCTLDTKVSRSACVESGTVRRAGNNGG